MKGILVLNKVYVKKEEGKKVYEEEFLGTEEGKYIAFSLIETAYLLEKGKMEIYYKGRKINLEEFFEYAEKWEKNFKLKYIVFKDLREKGYYIGTGYKFGSEFRVYDKEKNPRIERVHSKWVCYPVNPEWKFTLYEFSAKNRVAHSTRKRLLIAVPTENGVKYIEIKWRKM